MKAVQERLDRAASSKRLVIQHSPGHHPAARSPPLRRERSPPEHADTAACDVLEPICASQEAGLSEHCSTLHILQSCSPAHTSGMLLSFVALVCLGTQHEHAREHGISDGQVGNSARRMGSKSPEQRISVGRSQREELDAQERVHADESRGAKTDGCLCSSRHWCVLTLSPARKRTESHV